MTLQTVSQLIALCGLILTAAGGFGAYYFGEREQVKKDAKHQVEQQTLLAEFNALKQSTAQIDNKLELIYRAAKLKTEVWTKVEMKNVPPEVTDYLLVLFRTNQGRITGKVRIEGSEDVSSFSTTANDNIPIAVRNLWIASEGHYKTPTIMEFLITEKTSPDATLSIFTAGWIDTHDREPH